MAEEAAFPEGAGSGVRGRNAGDAGNGYENMPKLREDVYSPGERTALAGFLHGVQGEASCRDCHKNVPELREFVHRSLDG